MYHTPLRLQELVSEKLSVQQQSVELERLNEELEKIGLNREKLLQQEHTMEDRCLSLICSHFSPILGRPSRSKLFHV